MTNHVATPVDFTPHSRPALSSQEVLAEARFSRSQLAERQRAIAQRIATATSNSSPVEAMQLEIELRICKKMGDLARHARGKAQALTAMAEALESGTEIVAAPGDLKVIVRLQSELMTLRQVARDLERVGVRYLH